MQTHQLLFCEVPVAAYDCHKPFRIPFLPIMDQYVGDQTLRLVHDWSTQVDQEILPLRWGKCSEETLFQVLGKPMAYGHAILAPMEQRRILIHKMG
jgi:hypothetical protein